MDTEKRLKALVIHRDQGASCAYTAIARSVGWEVFSCEDTADVVGATRDHDPDVLILDFCPESGFEVLRKVRKFDPSLPSILVTAYPVDHQEAMSLGVKMTLPKPPDSRRLKESLAALAIALPVSDFKILFDFLERCQAPRHRK